MLCIRCDRKSVGWYNVFGERYRLCNVCMCVARRQNPTCIEEFLNVFCKLKARGGVAHLASNMDSNSANMDSNSGSEIQKNKKFEFSPGITTPGMESQYKVRRASNIHKEALRGFCFYCGAISKHKDRVGDTWVPSCESCLDLLKDSWFTNFDARTLHIGASRPARIQKWQHAWLNPDGTLGGIEDIPNISKKLMEAKEAWLKEGRDIAQRTWE